LDCADCHEVRHPTPAQRRKLIHRWRQRPRAPEDWKLSL